jgi:tRNA-intron endonuclease, archaea type
MKGYLKSRSCQIISNNLKSKLINKGYGVKREDFLELDLFESFYLFEKKQIQLVLDEKILNKTELEKYVFFKIKDFEEKYLVYKEFKEKGYIIKDGAIFGFDFRIYEGQSKTHEHTKYVVDVLKTHKDTVSKIIKSERLANSIKTKYIIAIVDFEKKITKIKLERI